MPGHQKILVIRFSSIGDIVLTTPVIRALATQLDAEIHVITKKAFVPILSANPHVSKVLTISDKVQEAAESLQAEKYDHVVDLHHNIRSYQVKKLVGATATSYPKSNLEKWLLVNFRIDRLPRKHVVFRYFEAAEPLGVKYDGKGLDYFIPREDAVDIAALTAGASNPGNYVALAVGAGFETKFFEDDQLRLLVQELEGPVVLIGGPQDRPRGEFLSDSRPGVINLVGQLSLGQSASVIQQARCLLSGDTGMMHIAAALDKPVVLIWGATSPIFGFRPFYSDNANSKAIDVAIEDLECRPCSKMGYHKCPLGHFRCIRDHNVHHIAQLANGVT